MARIAHRTSICLLLVLGSCVFEMQRPVISTENFAVRVSDTESDLAGSYVHERWPAGKNLLVLSDDGSFSETESGCCGRCREDHGTFHVEDGALVLVFAEDNLDKRPPLRLQPVHWGQRLYMIPEDGMQEFCKQVNNGDEPRDSSIGPFYLRLEDWNKPAAGRPRLPAAWRKYVLDRPARGRVVAVEQGNVAVVDLGEFDGLWEGMELYIRTEDPECSIGLEVISVAPHNARAKAETLCYRMPADMEAFLRLPEEVRRHRMVNPEVFVGDPVSTLARSNFVLAVSGIGER